jgi:hypothetical protein
LVDTDIEETIFLKNRFLILHAAIRTYCMQWFGHFACRDSDVLYAVIQTYCMQWFGHFFRIRMLRKHQKSLIDANQSSYVTCSYKIMNYSAAILKIKHCLQSHFLANFAKLKHFLPFLNLWMFLATKLWGCMYVLFFKSFALIKWGVNVYWMWRMQKNTKHIFAYMIYHSTK